jgi:tetraacyldisaccharide 4'-kinase
MNNLLYIPLLFASFIYNAITQLRRIVIERYFSCKPKAKVVSIGNLSFGGTGKTPLTIWLARQLQQSGYKVAIVSRGYNRKSKEDVILNPSVLLDYALIGDEVVELREALPDIPIVISEKKWFAAQLAEEHFQPDAILVDDGFQHYELEKDINIIIIDKELELSSTWNTLFYKLREPISRLRVADILVIKNNNIEKDNVVNIKYKMILEDIAESKYVTLSALGNNQKFIDGVNKLSQNSNCIYSFTFPDHHPYTIEDVNKIINKCNELGISTIITTKKDETKLKNFLNLFNERNKNLVVSLLELEIKGNREKLIEVFANHNLHLKF